MLKNDLKNWVCRPYCSFFREGEKEDLLCQGAWAVGRLAEEGLLDPVCLPDFNKSNALKSILDPELVDHICQTCPFQAEDCDFQSKTVSALPADVEPCGGYILLRLLKLNRYLDPSDIKALKQ